MLSTQTHETNKVLLQVCGTLKVVMSPISCAESQDQDRASDLFLRYKELLYPGTAADKLFHQVLGLKRDIMIRCRCKSAHFRSRASLLHSAELYKGHRIHQQKQFLPRGSILYKIK